MKSNVAAGASWTISAWSPAAVCALPARVRAWFFSDAASAAVAWCVAVLVLAAILAWFFLWSPFGAPAAPVYAEF